jgi:hypothetical protein
MFGFQGIQVAQANANVGYRASEESTHARCTFGTFSGGATAQGSSDASAGGLPGYSWTLTNKKNRCATGDSLSFCLEKCTYWGGDIYGEYRTTAGISAIAQNSASLGSVFDCSKEGGAKIKFNDVGVRSLKASGSFNDRWEIARNVEVTGPVAKCTENLYEDTAMLAECTPPD